jgi:hypothetical protein
MSRPGSIRRTVPALVAVFGTAALLLVLGPAAATPGDPLALQEDGRILAAEANPREHPERFTVSRYLATSPTTIRARATPAPYGTTVRVEGR